MGIVTTTKVGSAYITATHLTDYKTERKQAMLEEVKVGHIEYNHQLMRVFEVSEVGYYFQADDATNLIGEPVETLTEFLNDIPEEVKKIKPIVLTFDKMKLDIDGLKKEGVITTVISEVVISYWFYMSFQNQSVLHLLMNVMDAYIADWLDSNFEKLRKKEISND